MKITRKSLWPVGVIAMAVSMMAFVDFAEAQKIRVGMTVSSTGRFALAAQSGARGAQIWVDDVNSRGGVMIGGKAREIELVELDDRSDKQMVARVYATLIQDRTRSTSRATSTSSLAARLRLRCWEHRQSS
jgi:branched-chain amino acid transport system substrate-binding protein